MAETRFSFRPHEMRLMVGSLQAIRARVTYRLEPSLDSRDYCIYEFCGAEIDALLAKLASHQSDAA